MKSIFRIKLINWIAVHFACLTMIFAPIALGKEAETLNKNNLQQMIKEFGLNKKITLGEFWENSKVYMPGYVYKDLEIFVKENKNLQMPELILDFVKTTDGTEVPVLQFTQNGKSQSVQFFGKKNKWAKYNNVVLSAAELNRVTDAYSIIEGSDIKFKKEADLYRQNKVLKQQKSSKQMRINDFQKDFSRFNGFPRVTPQLWKSLNKEQRAGFIVKMRLMWMNAKKILSQNTGTGKPPTKTKESAKLESFYKFIFGFAAEAVNLPEKKSKVMSSPYNANSCVVAGYIGFYGKVNNLNGENRDGCSIGLAIAAYKTKENLKFVQEANEFCAVEKVTNVACNPIIYGFPNGKAACIDRRSAEYQQATHFTSPSNGETCDGKSRLSSAEEIVKFNDKDYSNIQPREKQIAAIEADQQKEDYALTQAYLKGVLEKKDPIMQALFEKGDWNLALDEELIHIQSQFEYEIESAIKTCESDISGKHEKNQKLACDQLHRRWLFTERAIANLRDKACVKPAHYVGNYNIGEASYAQTASVKTILNKKEIDSKGTALCECPAIEVTKDEVKVPVKLVSFAKACIDAVVVPEVVPTQKCDKPQGIVDFDYDKCLCLNEKKIKSSSGNEGIFICETEVNETKCDKPEEISGFNYDKCKCDDNKKLKQPAGNDKVYECEGANWVPWSLGGLGFLAVIAFFNRNNKPKAPPVAPKTGCTNICVSGTLNSTSCACDITPLGPSCVLPKIGNLPNCACPSAPSYCTTPQKIYDVSTCQCTNVPQPPVCADSTLAPNANLTMCPKCSNGAFKTTAGCPSEGGSGNNTCAHPPCSGGLPGTGI